jgi:hypothetical protein
MTTVKSSSGRVRLLASFAALLMLGASQLAAAELMMVERIGCHWCARWDREVAPIYAKTPEGKRAPLRRVDIDADPPRDVSLRSPVIYTPTFILIEDRREVGRLVGYMNDDMFWGLLSNLLKKLAP